MSNDPKPPIVPLTWEEAAAIVEEMTRPPPPPSTPQELVTAVRAKINEVRMARGKALLRSGGR